MDQPPSWLRLERIWELGGFQGKEVRASYTRSVESAVRQGLKQSLWENLRDLRKNTPADSIGIQSWIFSACSRGIGLLFCISTANFRCRSFGWRASTNLMVTCEFG